MGGAVPLGYRVENRALHIVEEQADFVRTSFDAYLEVGSVVRLKSVLDAENSGYPFGQPVGEDHGRRVDQPRPHLSHPLEPHLYRAASPQGTDSTRGNTGQSSMKTSGTASRSCLPTRRRRGNPQVRMLTPFSRASCSDDRRPSYGSEPRCKGRPAMALLYLTRGAEGRRQDAGSVARVPAAEIEKEVLEAVKRRLPALDRSRDGPVVRSPFHPQVLEQHAAADKPIIHNQPARRPRSQRYRARYDR